MSLIIYMSPLTLRDVLQIYRCYIVWRRRRIIVVAAGFFLVCSSGKCHITGISTRHLAFGSLRLCFRYFVLATPASINCGIFLDDICAERLLDCFDMYVSALSQAVCYLLTRTRSG